MSHLQNAIDDWHLFDHHGHKEEAALLVEAARRVANLEQVIDPKLSVRRIKEVCHTLGELWVMSQLPAGSDADVVIDAASAYVAVLAVFGITETTEPKLWES